ATYFARIDDLRASLLWWGAGLLALVLAATWLAAALIIRPVRQLAAAAARIGQGDLAAAIAPTSRDELGVLAQTMDTMRTQLAELAQPEATAAGLALAVVGDGAVPLHADAGQLRRALINLVRNAIQAAAAGGETGAAVTLGARARADAVELTVANRGQAIAAD